MNISWPLGACIFLEFSLLFYFLLLFLFSFDTIDALQLRNVLSGDFVNISSLQTFVVILGLTPNTQYHLRTVLTDIILGLLPSLEIIVSTPPLPTLSYPYFILFHFLQYVLKNLTLIKFGIISSTSMLLQWRDLSIQYTKCKYRVLCFTFLN